MKHSGLLVSEVDMKELMGQKCEPLSFRMRLSHPDVILRGQIHGICIALFVGQGIALVTQRDKEPR
jgi:hypothetical protein